MSSGDDGAPGEDPSPWGRGSSVGGRDGWSADPQSESYVPGPRPGCYPSPASRAVNGRPPASAGTDATAKRQGTRRRTTPAGAQQQLMARISAGRKARQQRALIVVCGAVSALVLLIAGSAWALSSYLNGHVGRVNAGTGGTPSSGPLNILVAGVDRRSGLTRSQEVRLHVGNDTTSNSDTMMIVHVPADHSSVSVISLPRDSWVDIPGHGMNKINAAFGLGGPKLMVQTVEENTGLTINDYIEVNFLGFVKVINALGGVNICLPYAVDDPYSGLRMAAGRHHVGGLTALEFARDRHSFALSDLARISDQQQLLSSMLSEAVSSGTLANPARLSSFLSAASAAVKVDQRLNVTSLADQLRGISASQVTFTTVPIASTNYTTPAGQSAVLWDSHAAARLFAAIKADKYPVRKSRKPGAGKQGSSLRRSQVAVDVYNGTLVGGLSASTGTQLSQLGFTVHKAGLSWSRSDVTQTVIEYPPGMIASARLVRKVLPGATVAQAKGLARVRVVLGTAGHQVTASPAGSAGHGSGAPGQRRTAAQAACKTPG
jgi:LCP family protein required for cell wall assembly